MGAIWGRQDPSGPHASPMNFTIKEGIQNIKWRNTKNSFIFISKKWHYFPPHRHNTHKYILYRYIYIRILFSQCGLCEITSMGSVYPKGLYLAAHPSLGEFWHDLHWFVYKTYEIGDSRSFEIARYRKWFLGIYLAYHINEWEFSPNYLLYVRHQLRIRFTHDGCVNVHFPIALIRLEVTSTSVMFGICTVF